MVDVPRRLTLSGAEKVAVIADRAAPGSHRGNTQWSKPPTAKTPTPQSTSGTFADERLSAYYTVTDTTTLTGDVFTIPSWGTFEALGTSVGLATPDDGVIHIFEPGVYAINLGLTVPASVAGAVVACSVRLYADLIVAYGATDIGCGVRGGDGCPDVPTFAAAAYIYSFPAGGSIAPALTYQNLDTTAVPHIDVNVDVVRIS